MMTAAGRRRSRFVLRQERVLPDVFELCKIVDLVICNVEKTGVVGRRNDRSGRDRPVRNKRGPFRRNKFARNVTVVGIR